MAEPLSTGAIGTAAAALAIAANVTGLVQGLDSYLSLVDPAEGCKIEAEPFVLKLPAKSTEEKQSVDKNKALRPEGARKPPSTGASTLPTFVSKRLVSVVTDAVRIDVYLGERRNPTAQLSLCGWRLGDRLACIPYLSALNGFDSRLGHQVSFTCNPVEQSDSSVILTTRVLLNPYQRESGFYTIWHLVEVDSQTNMRLEHLGGAQAPEQNFKVGYDGYPQVRIYAPAPTIG